jgi:hypothetical protein
MLPFYLAVALFAKTHRQPPRKAEHRALLEAVRGVYARLRVAPPTCATTALAQLQASAHVREVLDVALDGPAVTQPHSFVTHLEVRRGAKPPLDPRRRGRCCGRRCGGGPRGRLTPPSQELAATAQKHKTFVIENAGCVIYFKKAYYLVDEHSKKRVQLSDLFAKRRPCRSVIVVERS